MVEEPKDKAGAGAGQGGGGEEQEPELGHPPPVDFRLLLESFVGQAMFNLGKYPHPHTGKVTKNLAWAKYFIDSLGMLQDKTKGNLADDERRFLESMLSTLRLTYVEEMKGEKPPG